MKRLKFDFLTGQMVMVDSVTATAATKYYKCATVDTVNKTWTGYEAVLNNGVYMFEGTATTGLSYTTVTPVVGQLYTADCLVSISYIVGSLPPSGLISFLPLTSNASDTQGNHGGIASNVTFGTDGAVFDGTGYINISNPFAFVDMPEATMIMHVEIDQSLADYGGLFFDNNQDNNAVSAFLAKTADIKTNCYPNTSPPVMPISSFKGKLAFTRSTTTGLQKIIFGSSSQMATLQSRGGQGGTITQSIIGYSPNGGSPEYYFKGKIKNFAIYNRELTLIEMSYWDR